MDIKSFIFTSLVPIIPTSKDISMNNGLFSSNSNRESLEEFLDNATIGIHMVDENGVILFANKAEMDLLGFSEEEYIGQNIQDFHADKDVIDSIFSVLFSDQKLQNKPARLKCKDGSIKEVLISSNVYRENGAFKYTRCFTRDISSFRKSEQLLKFLNTSSEELSATLNYQEALDKIIKTIVPQYADWFTIDELQNDGFGQLVKMAHADPFKMEWAEEYRRLNPVHINDDTVGSVGWVLRTGQPVLANDVTDEMLKAGAHDDAHFEIIKQLSIKSVMIIPMIIKGNITGATCFISSSPVNRYDETDLDFAKNFTNRIAITLENARLYEKVQKDIDHKNWLAQKKDEFISIAGHELKTPLTSLKAYGQLLEMTFLEREDMQTAEMLSKMNKQVNKLTGLVSDLLDVSKIDKGELVFYKEEVDLNELITEIVEEVQRTTKTHSIKLKLEKVPLIKADRNRIGQVITNFITNAVKYSPNAAEVIVSSMQEEDFVKFCVHDFGIGISEEDQPMIFQRFFRASGVQSHTYPGLGLGLYISAEIIKRHGGKFSLKSTLGEGSEFCFLLPQ